MSRRAAPPSRALTPEQLALFKSEPLVPEEAVAATLKGMGAALFRHLEREDLRSIATIAVMESTASYDPARGSTYRTWAFFAAVNALLQNGRAEHQRHAKARALVRASVLMYLGRSSLGVDIGVETEETLTAKLHSYTNPVVVLALKEVAAMKPTTGGEDEVGELETAARAGDALREALSHCGAEERRVLEMHFRDGIPLTEVAAALGVDASGYRTFVRRFHDALAALREALAKRGIRERPPWREEVAGEVLGR
jgi:RNA polymerase sigma factor (sigma-70 family)